MFSLDILFKQHLLTTFETQGMKKNYVVILSQGNTISKIKVSIMDNKSFFQIIYYESSVTDLKLRAILLISSKLSLQFSLMWEEKIIQFKYKLQNLNVYIFDIISTWWINNTGYII